MALHFDEQKATQAAALLLKLRGGRMSFLKLLKLLYLVDRTALLRWGKPITMDHFVSMKYGPVLSTVYNLLSERSPGPTSVWDSYISRPQNYEVSLLRPAANDRLSRAEERLIEEVFSKYGHLDRWALVKRLHTELPEWTNPEDTSIPISITDILKTEICDEQEIQAILDELQSLDRGSSELKAVS